MFAARILAKSNILCLASNQGQVRSRVLSFGTEQEWTFAHISNCSHLVLVNTLKELFLLNFDIARQDHALGKKIVLPKGITHGWSEKGVLYLSDRSGDLYSQPFDKLKLEIEENGDKPNEICKDLTLETSNFCQLVSCDLGKVKGTNVFALADQYYKIRLLNRDNLHEMLMTVSLRTRYAENVLIFKERSLLAYYDDGKLQLLDQTEVENSLNEDKNYIGHQLVGKVQFFALKDDQILVHSLDRQELLLCTLHEAALTLEINDKVALDAAKLNEVVVLGAGIVVASTDLNHEGGVSISTKTVNIEGLKISLN